MAYKKRFKVALAVVVVLLLFIETEARLRASLTKIQNTLTTVGRNVKGRVDKINKFLDSDTGDTAVQTVTSAIDTIGETIPSITSGDVMGIVSGTMDVISAVTSVIPVIGPIISTIFSLFSTILGSVGAGVSEDVGSIVKREIQNALNKYDDSNLRAQAAGAARIYRNSHRYLNAKEHESKLQRHEVAALAANVPIYHNIKFLGILGSKIKDGAKSKNVDQAKRAVTYISLYVKLAVLRSAILWQMYSLVKTAGHSEFTANAIKRFIEGDESEDRETLKFLATPEYDKAIFFQVLYPSKIPDVSKFLERKGLKFQHLNFPGGAYTLRPEKWQNWYMLFFWLHVPFGIDKFPFIIGESKVTSQTKFIFTSISSYDNTFYLRPLNEQAWYVYMTDHDDGTCSASHGKPGPAGEWKITRFSDGKYMMSPKRWPNWFIFMNDDDHGTIRGWNGDPGIQGHWLINRI